MFLFYCGVLTFLVFSSFFICFQFCCICFLKCSRVFGFVMSSEMRFAFAVVLLTQMLFFFLKSSFCVCVCMFCTSVFLEIMFFRLHYISGKDKKELHSFWSHIRAQTCRIISFMITVSAFDLLRCIGQFFSPLQDEIYTLCGQLEQNRDKYMYCSELYVLLQQSVQFFYFTPIFKRAPLHQCYCVGPAWKVFYVLHIHVLLHSLMFPPFQDSYWFE